MCDNVNNYKLGPVQSSAVLGVKNVLREQDQSAEKGSHHVRLQKLAWAHLAKKSARSNPEKVSNAASALCLTPR